jgi:hypothetical protein
MNADKILVFFKLMKTRDILWLLLNAKLDNAAEWVQKRAYALHQWGAKGKAK